MPDDLFPRAKRVGLESVRSWLPNGHVEGDEWIALNPTRADEHKGSFRINLKTGRWSDFADDSARGNDIVSCYAYVHENALSQRASEFKNYRSGLQVVAAQDILVTYDDSYFPSPSDKFNVPTQDKSSGGYWDGWRYDPRGVADPPELDTSWYAKNWGSEKNRWRFTVGGKTVLFVCRFIGSDGKKDDRPFTLWTDGAGYRWRAKAPQDKYPLWNIDDLDLRPNAPVVLTEGQKIAAALKHVITDYVCVGWYGGTNAVAKQDWEPLRGREVWFPFDADAPGRKALSKIRTVSEQYDIKLHPVYPPQNVKRGWDLADAVDEGWSGEKISAYLTADGDRADEGGFVDDPGQLKFEILGYSGDQIVFFPHGHSRTVSCRASGITKGHLLQLSDKLLWQTYFQTEKGGVAWDDAINWIIRVAEEKPMWDKSRVRGTGIWREGNSVVANTGAYILIDGERRELHESKNGYLYERDTFIPYGMEEPLEVNETRKLMEILKLVDWKHPAYPAVLAGWLTLAPFGGALNWRPYVWITGPIGKGKSWILDNVAAPLVGGEYGIYARGTSTPAGVRDALQNRSLPTIMDEMESDNQMLAERIDQNLRMFREGSSGSGAVTLHGTQDGQGREWIVKSMALFASVGAAIKHGADRSRFTEIQIGGPGLSDPISVREKRFRELELLARVITESWSRAYHTRSLRMFSEIERCIHIMSEQATQILGNRRAGDQIGALMAGAWMSTSDTASTAAEAKAYLMEHDVKHLTEAQRDKSDEELCLDEILSARIDVNDGSKTVRTTIGAALNYWYSQHLALVADEIQEYPGFDAQRMRKQLEQYGVKPVSDGAIHRIQIAAGHTAIRKILKDTPWPTIYDAMIGRLPYASDTKGPSRFAGVGKRYRELDAAEVLDEVPF